MIKLRAGTLVVVFCLFASLSFSQTVSTTAVISTVAGGTRSFNGDGASVTNAQLNAPTGLLFDADGNLLIADSGHHTVRRVTPAGIVSTIVGNGLSGNNGDGGPATSAKLARPEGLAFDGSGNLYVADYVAHVIRRVTPAGTISTFAGTGDQGFGGDGGPALAANLNAPLGMAFDSAGNLYFADTANKRIRKITPTGTISTFAGNGITGYNGNNGPATSAQLGSPSNLVFDSTGNLFFSDFGNHNIRKVTPAGVISTFAGPSTQIAGGDAGFAGDGGPATLARFANPEAVLFDSAGNLLVSEYSNHRIRKITPAGIISTFVGVGTPGSAGDGGPASAAQLINPNGMALDAAGNLFISNTGNYNIRKVNTDGIISMYARGFAGDGGPAVQAVLQAPTTMVFDAAGNLYIADYDNRRVRKVTPAGVISTFAGNGNPGAGGDGGQATLAPLAGPAGLVMDSAGNLFISDDTANVIRKVTPAGIISTVAGNKTYGFSGDGGPATSAQLASPVGLALDSHGNLFIADTENYRIRMVSNGIITTVAGVGTEGYSGDGGPATAAELAYPIVLVFDSSGNLLVSDGESNNVRMISPAGLISTVIGKGTPGFSPAASVQLNFPTGLLFDKSGNLFLSDTSSHRVLKITTAGAVTTVAGTGALGVGGDGGPAESAQFDAPVGMAIDAAGNLFIADNNNHNVRKVAFIQQISFSMVDRGGTTLTSVGSGSSTVVGYGIIKPNTGSTTPSGLAIFGFRQGNVLVSEAGVPAVPAITSGRIYAEVNTSVNTGVVFANPNNQAATISYYFSSSNGTVGTNTMTLAANGQFAAFINQAPFNRGTFGGTFTFSSDVPLAVVALRGLTNERGEFLITTLPVVDLTATPSSSSIVFPHFAEGGGWSTSLILINPGETALTGTVQFRGPTGSPSVVTVNGFDSSTFTYNIPARSSGRVVTAGTAVNTLSGSVVLTPASGNVTPVGVAVFSYRTGGITVSEAGVPAAPAGTAFRLYAETSSLIQTGVAIANNSASSAVVTLSLTKLDGTPTGLSGTLTIPANGQTATFLNGIAGFASLPSSFQGVLRISSTASLSVAGLRGRYNERNDFLITTTPPVNESSSLSNAPLYFPQIADSGGYTTQFILFSGQSGQSSAGVVQLFSQSGGSLNLTTPK